MPSIWDILIERRVILVIFQEVNVWATSRLASFRGAEKALLVVKESPEVGIGSVMCNTPQGRSLYETVLKYVESMECPVEWAIQGDVRLRHTEQRPGMRDKAYKLLSEKGMLICLPCME